MLILYKRLAIHTKNGLIAKEVGRLLNIVPYVQIKLHTKHWFKALQKFYELFVNPILFHMVP